MPPVSDGIVSVPRVEHDHSRVTGLREHLASRCRATIDKLPHATECEIYDFTRERDRLCDRLIDIETGRDVTVYRFELGEYAQPREDGQHVYILRGDPLVTAGYERVVPSWDNRW
jgi:hypothetical protein